MHSRQNVVGSIALLFKLEAYKGKNSGLYFTYDWLKEIKTDRILIKFQEFTSKINIYLSFWE